MTNETLEVAIPRMIAEVLALEVSECVPDARFFADLNGESIDLLDLQFQIEKQLGIRVQLDVLASGDLLAADYRDVITPESLERIRRTFPFLPTERLPENATVHDARDLLTVRVIVEFTALAQREGSLRVAPAVARG